MAFKLHPPRFPSLSTGLRAGLLGALVLPVLLAVASPARADMDLPLESPIVRTMMNQNWDELKRAFLGGTNVNGTDNSKQPLIVLAARNNLIPAIDIMLDQRAKVDQPDPFGNSALLWAADQNNVEIVDRLIKAGANINLQNRQGVTALMRASEKGSVAAVEKLLKAGADVTLNDYTGRDALSWAQAGGNGKIQRLLEKAR